MLNVIVIYLPYADGKKPLLADGPNDLINRLTMLLSKNYDGDRQKDLWERFAMDLDADLKGDVKDMCSFSESYIKKGMRIGRQEGMLLGEKRGMKKGVRLGMQQGMQQGVATATSQINALNKYLAEQQKYDELNRSFSDSEYQKTLFKKYGKFLNPPQ